MIKTLLLFLILNLNLNYTQANLEEKMLRNHLFNDYNKLVRPITDYRDSVNISMGLGVQNLEAFNQKEETIDINLWVRLNWYDKYLNWDSNISNLTFLSVDQDYVWVPDIELLNAASLPDIYTLKGGMNLYSNGLILWSNPAVFRFSCPLDLHYFPFDTQRCRMKFSSWIYNNNLLKLHPHKDVSKQIDILNTFSHSEWKIRDVKVDNYIEKRPCCPNVDFDVNEYTIELRRYPHYYNISMGMTISLVIVNFIIMLVKPNNISRTSTAVFIPLTILALQLTLADKIPVVGYYTLMDYFFLCCFITSMICSIQSGIVYALLTSKSRFIYLLFKDRFDLEKLIQKDKSNIKQEDSDIDNSTNETDVDEEFNDIINGIRTKSYKVAVNHPVKEPDEEQELPSTPEKTQALDIKLKTKVIDEDIEDSALQTNNIVKTIDYDDEMLTMSYKEILVFKEIERYVRRFDNCCRVIIPMIFIVCISVIYSYR
tara:strand:- start:1266 stop:2717 length:1452 start_codon:yes stop_codon:yes gene_type:complete